ncbi:Retrovirus-related Pol polyprotein from transposon RE2 [Vitis vinifera]|uniref:Retrovirus-related Pol polyprotein from transposon RE2 n=1 Tax=Vitis vinifera TaxID=29760 RepID=A0A438CUE8_VITVI|nr:Retrovirus-related Pol polyprotein from transposon RE2 [Vitis vinifera]
MSSPTQPTFEIPLVVFNITAQINEKLTPSSFPQWRAQFKALLIGYDLMDYITSESRCPPSDGTPPSIAKKHHWVRQDKLILSAILASTSPTITSLIATAKTSYDAWKKLSTMYVSLVDEIALIDHPISDDDITLYVLNGLGPEFREIAAPIRAREKSLAFEELHDLLIRHENYLHRMEAATQQLVATGNFTSRRSGFSASQQQKASHKGNGSPRSQGHYWFSSSNGPSRDPRRSNNQGQFNSNKRRYQPKCQYYDQMGHTAKACPQLNSSEMTVNCAGTSDGQENKWLIDSAASHNITRNIKNLSIHSEYDGTDEVLLGDGTIHGGDTTKRAHSFQKPSTGHLPKPTYFPLLLTFSFSRTRALISFPSSFHSCSSISSRSLLTATTELGTCSCHSCTTSSELTALMRHGTWDLIPPPINCHPVGCKWVFRVKRKADGSVDKFKARLVAKGYNQQPSVDYNETFSPVVKPATIRTLLSIAIMNGWPLKQMDVNNAFLHGNLTETVYMMQPPGFKDLSLPDYVCRLRKAIYDLKQAPKAWYSALKTALLALGFQNSKVDSSLFIYRHDSMVCYFLVYVDDLVITDMGSLHYFLGQEVIPTTAGVFLSQHKYVRDILENTHMAGAKDVFTPLSTTQSLHLVDVTNAVNSTEYRRVIGSLQYLSLTQPDISFAC